MLLKLCRLGLAGLLVITLNAACVLGGGDSKVGKVTMKLGRPLNQQTVSGANVRAGSAAKKAAADKDYIIGPDDVLAVNVWKEPEVSQTVTVRPDGKISLPLAGEIVASGLTPDQLQIAISHQLENVMSRPEVTVIVHEVKSQRVVVAGQVAKPGPYELQTAMTVLDAIAGAGGPTEYARVKRIYVLRVGADGNATRIPFNYKQVIKGQNLSQNVRLEPHDTIVVP